jgi:hypothetical protein
MADKTVNNTIVKKLSAKLKTEWIKTLRIPGRPELSYVSIDKVIKSLNDNFGDDWNITITNTTWLNFGQPAVSITVALEVKDGDTTAVRYGTGSDIHKPGKNSNGVVDPDKLSKTAYANAVKKAANMFGFALELWDESNLETEGGIEAVIPDVVTPQSQAAVQTGTTVTTAQTVPDNGPKKLSDESKAKVAEFCKNTGLAKNDLEDFLKEYKPESKGNPAIFCHGDEAKNLQEFFDHVNVQLAKK